MENKAIQNPTPEPILTPVQVSEPKDKFPVIYLVLSLFILLLLASTGFLYYQNIQLKNMLASYQTQSTVSPTPAIYQSPIPSTTADPTANWKTYTNKDLDYTIKLPSQFFIDERGCPNNLHFTFSSTTTPPAGLLDIYINVPAQCSSENQCLTNLMTSYRGAQSAGSKALFNQISTTIAGKMANGIEYWDPGINEGGTVIPSNLTYEYFINNNGKVLDFQFVINKYQNIDEAKTQKVFVDQILSTFKFTN
uniref:Uncharacterized protein n=1 Tax=candidate division CPR3 bacterium TaxID=2268181 RepID=A0A7V3N4W8_UNCC3